MNIEPFSEKCTLALFGNFSEYKIQSYENVNKLTKQSESKVAKIHTSDIQMIE